MQVLEDQPWLYGALGEGVDALSGERREPALEPFTLDTTRWGVNGQVRRQYQVVADSGAYQAIYRREICGAYGIMALRPTLGPTPGAADAPGLPAVDYVNSITFSRTSFSLVCTAEYGMYWDGYFPPTTSWTFKREALDAMRSPVEFQQRYGDYFVSSAKYGSRLIVVCRFMAPSESVATWMASQLPTVPWSGHTIGSDMMGFYEMAANCRATVDAVMFVQGAKDRKSATIRCNGWRDVYDVEGPFSTIHGIDPVPLRAQLTPYAKIADPSYRSRELDEATFSGIRTLAVNINEASKSFSALPNYYKRASAVPGRSNEALLDELQKLVMANRQALVSDPSALPQAQCNAEALLKATREARDRFDVYRYLELVSTRFEPAIDDPIHKEITVGCVESTSGITITEHELDVAKDWSLIGQDRTVQVPPPEDVGSSLVVGWKLLDCWRQSDNSGGSGQACVVSKLVGKRAGSLKFMPLAWRGLHWKLTYYQAELGSFPWLLEP